MDCAFEVRANTFVPSHDRGFTQRQSRDAVTIHGDEGTCVSGETSIGSGLLAEKELQALLDILLIGAIQMSVAGTKKAKECQTG